MLLFLIGWGLRKRLQVSIQVARFPLDNKALGVREITWFRAPGHHFFLAQKKSRFQVHVAELPDVLYSYKMSLTIVFNASAGEQLRSRLTVSWLKP